CNGAGKPGAWKAHDGILWFPTTKGLVAVDPKIEIQNTPPPVFIEELDADRKLVMSGGLGIEHSAALKTGGNSNNPVRIAPGRGELEFHFTALNFQTPEKSRFRYKLENVDLNWSEPDP